MDIDKAIETTHNLLNKVDYSDLNILLVVICVAEQNNLAKYVRSITRDEFIARNNGPVPSFIFDISKSLNKNRTSLITELYKDLKAEFKSSLST